MESRLVLGIDNSIDFLTVALALEERLIEERRIKSKKAPSEIIPVEVAQVLSDHGHSPEEIGLIVVSLGPGSFTGIRVALSFAKGMSAAAGIPLVGIPTLDLLVTPLAFMEGYYLCPLLDAKKGEVFCSLYSVKGGKIERQRDYQAVKPSALPDLVQPPCLCFGTGVLVCEKALGGMEGVTLIGDGFRRVSGEVLIQEGIRRAPGLSPGEIRPIYGRRSEAELKYNLNLT
jgi:tRNA threonylcarbamoyladenosine biosynthesis protein TsaB